MKPPGPSRPRIALAVAPGEPDPAWEGAWWRSFGDLWGVAQPAKGAQEHEQYKGPAVSTPPSLEGAHRGTGEPVS